MHFQYGTQQMACVADGRPRKNDIIRLVLVQLLLLRPGIIEYLSIFGIVPSKQYDGPDV